MTVSPDLDWYYFVVCFLFFFFEQGILKTKKSTKSKNNFFFFGQKSLLKESGRFSMCRYFKMCITCKYGSLFFFVVDRHTLREQIKNVTVESKIYWYLIHLNTSLKIFQFSFDILKIDDNIYSPSLFH